VLDVASAPGGKTTHIAQMMGNAGVLLANDLKKDRLASLQGNLARLGVTNSVVCSMDGRKLPETTRGFDRVLLDAPCTGLGVIARDPSARTRKTMDDVFKMDYDTLLLAMAATVDD
jgi:ribosomal RNA methyltransferase Nop2